MRAGEDIPDPECDGGTSDMVKCLAAATAKWDKRLNAAYRDALKEAPAGQRELLRKAQRLWLQYRDANCEYYALSEGSIVHVLAATCLLDMTNARAKELEAAPGTERCQRRVRGCGSYSSSSVSLSGRLTR